MTFQKRQEELCFAELKKQQEEAATTANSQQQGWNYSISSFFTLWSLLLLLLSHKAARCCCCTYGIIRSHREGGVTMMTRKVSKGIDCDEHKGQRQENEFDVYRDMDDVLSMTANIIMELFT